MTTDQEIKPIESEVVKAEPIDPYFPYVLAPKEVMEKYDRWSPHKHYVRAENPYGYLTYKYDPKKSIEQNKLDENCPVYLMSIPFIPRDDIPWWLHFRNRIIRLGLRLGWWFSVLYILPHILYYPLYMIFGLPHIDSGNAPWWAFSAIFLLIMWFGFAVGKPTGAWIETVYNDQIYDYCRERFPVRNKLSGNHGWVP